MTIACSFGFAMISGTQAPVGRCIYCLEAAATAGRLTREHVIPAGLGGKLILPEASCETCRRITHGFETTCLRTMFGNARVQLDYPSGQPEERPERLKFSATVDGKPSQRYEALSDTPAAIFLYAFDDARIIRGHHDEFSTAVARPWFYPINFSRDLFKKLGIDALQAKFHPLIFGRMLAKIAHGYAVAVYGLDGFVPLLTELICGTSANLAYLVGGIFTDEPPGTDIVEIDIERERSQNDSSISHALRVLNRAMHLREGPGHDKEITVSSSAVSATATAARTTLGGGAIRARWKLSGDAIDAREIHGMRETS